MVPGMDGVGRQPIDERAYAQPAACRVCGHPRVQFDWGQACSTCLANDAMWVCGADWRHFWPVDEHVHGQPQDRRPSWERGDDEGL